MKAEQSEWVWLRFRRRRLQWQHVVAILQEDDCLTLRFVSLGLRYAIAEDVSCSVRFNEGILKQTEFELFGQQSADGFIKALLGDHTGVDQSHHLLVVAEPG